MVVWKSSLSINPRVKYNLAFNLSVYFVVYSLVIDLKGGVRYTCFIACMSWVSKAPARRDLVSSFVNLSLNVDEEGGCTSRGTAPSERSQHNFISLSFPSLIASSVEVWEQVTCLRLPVELGG
jgi:hypothetical protein